MRKILILFAVIVCSLFISCEELDKTYLVIFKQITDKEYKKWEPFLVNGVLHDNFDNLEKLSLSMPGTDGGTGTGAVGYSAFRTWDDFTSELSSFGCSQYKPIIQQELKKQKNVMILHDYPYKDTSIMIYIEDFE